MKRYFAAIIYISLGLNLFSQNPIVTDIFTADPAALVYNDTVFLYTGHDEATATGTFYSMNDWQCFTTTDMVNWTSRGEVFNVGDVSWAKGDAWAGQVAERNGKFYFYFCAEHKSITGKAVGVAVADSPFGPFTDIGHALITNDMTDWNSTWDDIDPTIFIDNGQAYMYWGNSQCYYIKLKENMTETEGDIVKVNLRNFTEAPYLHKKDDTYYLSYAYGWPEKIAYASSSSIEGPWTFQSVINDNVNNSGTNHQSIIEFKGQWYFIYHTGDIGGDYQRSVAVEYLYYNDDNTIKEIMQTPYGVAHVDSTAICPPSPITTYSQIDEENKANQRLLGIDEGDNVSLMPQSGLSGSWKWEGPNGFTSTDSVVTLPEITEDKAGIYYATFTNACGTKSYANYKLKIAYGLPSNIESGKVYKIEPVNSSKVITVENKGTTNGSNIIQANDEGLSTQKFTFTLIDDTYWKLTPFDNDSRAMDVLNISTEDGANIVIWEYWGGSGQQWQIIEKETGIYNIVSRNSGKCLDVNQADNNIIQWACTGVENQQFKIVETSTTGFNNDLNEEFMKLFPNPGKSNELNITLNNKELLEQVELYDSVGHTVYLADNLNQNSHSPEINLIPGTYIVKVKTNNNNTYLQTQIIE